MRVSAKRDQIQSFIEGEDVPRAVDAERALVGMALADVTTLDFADNLKADLFYDPLWGRIWSTVSERNDAGQITDPTILSGLFASDEAFAAMGGADGLRDLMDVAAGPSRAGAYANEIRQAAARRALVRLSLQIGEKAMDLESGSVSEVLSEFERGAALIGQTADLADEWQRPGEMISGALERARIRKGVLEFPLGISEVDRITGGLHREEVTVVAARPGIGKTVAAQAIAKAAASVGYATPFFALEMGPDPMAIRLACDVAFDRSLPTYLGKTSNITLERINRDELEANEWERLELARREIARWPLRFDTRPGHTMQRIEALARRFYVKAERAGVPRGPLIIDHMGKVAAGKNRQGNLRLETIDISRDASEMAKRLKVPVVLLCQLSRAIEGRQDKQPSLADLREAGQIEEDARQVIFLHRPEYYLRPPADEEDFQARTERETKLDAARNKLFWIVAKNSHGPNGSALTFCEIAASAVREWRQ